MLLQMNNIYSFLRLSAAAATAKSLSRVRLLASPWTAAY